MTNSCNNDLIVATVGLLIAATTLVNVAVVYLRTRQITQIVKYVAESVKVVKK